MHVFSLKAPASGNESKHDGRSLSDLHNGSGTSISGSPPSSSANNPSSTLSFMKGNLFMIDLLVENIKM